MGISTAKANIDWDAHLTSSNQPFRITSMGNIMGIEPTKKYMNSIFLVL